MLVLTGGRRSGKTTSIIQAMDADPRVLLVVAGHVMYRVMIDQHPHLRNRIICAEANTLRGIVGHGERVILDNAELILEDYLGHRGIYGATMTGRSHNL